MDIQTGLISAVKFLIRVFFGYKPYRIKYLGSATGIVSDRITKWKYWTGLGLHNLRSVEHWQVDMWVGLVDQAGLQVRKDKYKKWLLRRLMYAGRNFSREAGQNDADKAYWQVIRKQVSSLHITQ